MRRLPLLLALLLLSMLVTAVSAQASFPPAPQLAAPLLAEEEDESEEAEEPEEECVIEDEEDVQICAEIAQEERESAEAERCVLESASASVSANPKSGKVRLTVRYTTYGPAPFSLRYSLRGAKGALQLGATKARFGLTGAFHDVVEIDERQLPKVLAAREFQIELRAQNAPGSCRESLTVAPRGGGKAQRP